MPLEILSRYQPDCPAQKAAKVQIEFAYEAFGTALYTRENPLCHFTASSLILNEQKTHTLMVYHNIYQSWSWTGGHTDGETDFLSVALKEAKEETGLGALRPLSPYPVRWDVLCVKAHEKHGNPVAPHLHLNAAFVFTADENAPLSVCPEENSAVRWLPLASLETLCGEPFMLPIYQSLIQSAKTLLVKI